MELKAQTRIPQRGELWRHFKGARYRIVGTGHNSEEPFDAVVVYEPAHWHSPGHPNVWVRSLNSFLGMSPVRDQPLFVPIEDQEK